MASIPLLILLAPMALQAVAMAVDEFYFHRKRGLARWERVGHPLDTLTVLSCFGFLVFAPISEFNLYLYMGLSFFSCVFVTKDEFVHTEVCKAGENWLHAILFVLHPIVFFCAGAIWYFRKSSEVLSLQAAFVFVFLIYQIIYWSIYGQRQQRDL
jgi:hypothetical protein